ncbi:interferon a3 [Haplochromis burtoni]|uniref:interferon a3 n=1 Tax=Haplochromis burtoni TaxID=8153 RepID=UPI0003BC7FEE|nr:interferon a3 [Haplochromis burtoni]
MVTWTGLLFVLCGALTPALCCDWLTHYKQPSKEARGLLTLMGDQLTEQHSSVHPVRFPKHLYKQIKNSEVDSKLVFIRDSLQLIFCLYRHDNLSAAPWGADKTEGFLTVIHRQIMELSACVSTNSPANSRLRSYYRTLANSTLSCSGCSTASWQLLRKETKLRLEQLELLVASIRVPAAANRRRSAATQQQRNTDTISDDCF